DSGLLLEVRTLAVESIDPVIGKLGRDASGAWSSLHVTPRSLQPLLSGGMVDDDIVYSTLACAASEYSVYGGQFVVWTSFAYTRWLEAKPIADVFDTVRRTRFWACPSILVPVFHDIHWTAAYIVPANGTIEYFDSI
ncbi:hypothetical protein BKA62DRAFT_598031, partial [Auriculariales sp. MPI-PUGE-AT-0066]